MKHAHADFQSQSTVQGVLFKGVMLAILCIFIMSNYDNSSGFNVGVSNLVFQSPSLSWNDLLHQN